MKERAGLKTVSKVMLIGNIQPRDCFLNIFI